MPNLSDFLSPRALNLLTANGTDLIETIGIDVIRNVVLDVLTGRNIRSSTETLTRRRIAVLNLAMVKLFIDGSRHIDDFVEQLPFIATEALARRNVAASDKLLAKWVLGLTGKGFQNILRSN